MYTPMQGLGVSVAAAPGFGTGGWQHMIEQNPQTPQGTFRGWLWDNGAPAAMFWAALQNDPAPVQWSHAPGAPPPGLTSVPLASRWYRTIAKTTSPNYPWSNPKTYISWVWTDPVSATAIGMACRRFSDSIKKTMPYAVQWVWQAPIYIVDHQTGQPVG
jgi:hypothetical protein